MLQQFCLRNSIKLQVINEDLLNYIKLLRQKSLDDEIIKAKLVSAGWQQDSIKAAFSSLNPPPELKNEEEIHLSTTPPAVFVDSSVSEEKKSQKTKPKIFLIVFIIFLLFAGTIVGAAILLH